MPDRPELSTSGLLQQNPSNQTAEITAGIKALEIAKRNRFAKVVIFADSKYLINAATTWLERWRETGFKDHRKRALSNQALLIQLSDAATGLEVEWVHVKGHNNDQGNDMADRMAREALAQPILSFVKLTQDILREDPELEQILDSIDEQSGKFLMVSNLLYHQRPDEEKSVPRLVVPTHYRELLLRLAHDDQLYGGHLGCRKTMKKLHQFWWPNMSGVVTRYVRACSTCQVHKHPKQPPPGFLHSIPVSKIFARVHIDIVGPINKSASANHYILTAIDSFSRYGFAVARPQARVDECLEFIESIIAAHGAPIVIVSDRGAQFTSHKWLDKMREFGIQHQFTSPYHPQSNGMDERFNGSLIKILKAYVNEHQIRWDEHLKWALFVYNTAYQESIKFSPYEVMYGCKARSPLNLQPTSELSLGESRTLIRREAAANSHISQCKQKAFYDRNRVPAQLSVGQVVLMRNNGSGPDQTGKFVPKWIGPAIVLELPTNSDDEPLCAKVLDLAHSRCRTVAVKDLKPYNLVLGLFE